jgi:AbrB family looped-hinge helix DNA binding protein
MTTIVNEHGQITLPEDMRAALGWQPGSKLILDTDDKGELFLRPERIAKSLDPNRFQRAVGILPPWPGGTDAYMKFIRGED